MNLAELLARRGRQHPRHPAVSVGDRLIASYGDLALRAGALARALVERRGLRPGDRVVIYMANCPEYVQLLFGLWTAGLIAVPVNSRLHCRELQFILQDTGANVLFTDVHHLESATAASQQVARCHVLAVGTQDFGELCNGNPMSPVSREPHEHAWIFYTSGTTGRPKGATLSHRNLLAMALSYHADIEVLSTKDTLLHAAPMSHGSGLYTVPYVMQGAHQVIPSAGHFSIEAIREVLSAHDRVSFFAAPTMLNRLIGKLDPYEVSRLRTIVYGGAPMYLEDCRRALDYFGPRLTQIYGQGESPMTITALNRDTHENCMHPNYLARLGSVGVSRTGVELRVSDQDGRTLGPGILGEVLVRGDVVMSGYWGDAEATHAALRDGWLRTGDLGVCDEDGFLTLKDRSKDVIISGGSNIYPREVEEVLLRHPDIAEVSVIGVPHADWGEQVAAFVVARPDAVVPTGELDRLCCENIARFKRPRCYIALDSLPKNSYGKVLKGELREIYRLPYTQRIAICHLNRSS